MAIYDRIREMADYRLRLEAAPLKHDEVLLDRRQDYITASDWRRLH